MVAPICIPVLLVSAGMLAGMLHSGARDLFLCGLFATVLLSLPAFFSGRRSVSGFLPLLLSLLLLGAARTSLRMNPRLPADHLARMVRDEPVFLEGVLCEAPRLFPSCTMLLLNCLTIREAGESRRATGRVDLFLNGKHPGFRAGDLLLVKARIRRIRAPGNPGPMKTRYRSFLRGVYVRGSVQVPGHICRLRSPGGSRAEGIVSGIRERVGGFLREGGSPRTEALLKVWLLGDRSSLPKDLREDFRASGLAHLLALSGLHVGMVFLFLYGFWNLLLRGSVRLLLRGWVQKLAILFSLPGVLFYILLAGSPVTAVRAGLMAALIAGAMVLGRSPSLWNGLGVAALVILLRDPAALVSPSFLLSFVTVGILMVGTPAGGAARSPQAADAGSQVGAVVRKMVSGVRGLLGVSLKACLAVAPLTACFFHTVTPLAVAANLVAVPLVCWLVLPLGMIAGGLSLICVPAARAVLRLEGVGVERVAETAGFFARIPGACIRTGAPSLLELFCYYSVLVIVILRGRAAWRHPLVLPCLAVLLISIASSILGPRISRDLKMTFLSVGNGDSALVEFPGGRRMLVDGGPAREGAFDAGERIVAPFLGAKRFCRVDILVVSHGQADHYGGLRYVLEHFRPEEIWTPPETGAEEAGYRAFLRACEQRGVPRKRICRGMVLPPIDGVEMEVLHPPCEERPGEAPGPPGDTRGVNDASLVLKMTYGSVRFLFTGDIEKGAETALLSQGKALESCLLKIPHHGSGSSSSEAFLDRVNPRMAVISSGAGNRFGFPSETVLERYRRRGVSVYRTSIHGAVQVWTDGGSVTVTTHREGREKFFRETVRRRSGGDPSAQVPGAVDDAQPPHEQQDIQPRKGRHDPHDGPP